MRALLPAPPAGGPVVTARRARRRYPGLPTFGDDSLSRRLFFGRSREVQELRDLVLAHRLVVLYARSGMGKTSLLNAGLKEPLWQDGLVPLPVRLNDPDAGPFKTLHEGIDQAVADRKTGDPGVRHVPGSGPTLWHHFKTAEFWRGDRRLTPLLILDQFEELFTLQRRQARERFATQLAELVGSVRPSIPAPDRRDDGAPRLTSALPEVRVLIALREDYLGHLEELSAVIPELLDTRFRLGPLLEAEARQAVEAPAGLDLSGLETRPFEYAPAAVDGIWAFLSRRLPDQVAAGAAHVEPFQLQLVCQRAEEIALRAQADGDGSVTITWDALGKEAGLQATMASFYERQLSALSSGRARRTARRLCEYGLISRSGRRLSREEAEIWGTYRVGREALGQLVEQRLLRHEARVGSWYYELSHDTLAEPILAARRRRQRRHRWALGASATALSVAALLGTGTSTGYFEQLGPTAVRTALGWGWGQSESTRLAGDVSWIRIPAPPGGEFLLGCVVPADGHCVADEQPRHAVKLSEDFDLMTHEVTVGQFQRFRASSILARWLVPAGSMSEREHPMAGVSWYGANAFCAFVGGRLPTEAESEYASRGSHSDRIYPWGDSYSKDHANGAGVGGRDQWEGPAPVKSFPPNSFGLHDMAGNVSEWTSTLYRKYPYDAGDGREDPASSGARVIRGGAFNYGPWVLRVSYRSGRPPFVQYKYLGFRCARDGSP